MTSLLIKLFVKNSTDTSSPEGRQRYGTFGGIVGIFCNLLLCTIKISIGAIVGSMSIVADGLNNLSDMGSSIITMIGFKLSNKPADSDHPFGHGRMEYISAFIVAGLILVVGFELLISSVKALVGGEALPHYSTVSIVVLAISVLVKGWMYLFNKSLGKRINSTALFATAQDSLNDAITTTAILASVIISRLVSLPFNLDAVMAIAVAVFIIYSGISSAKDTIGEILGGPPEPELIKELEESIMSFEGFCGIHDLIVHNYGPGRQFASVHVEISQNADIVEAHEKIDLCEKLVTEKTGVMLVIHMDPVDIDSPEVQKTKAALVEIIKSINSGLTLHDFRMTPHAENRTNLIFDVVVPSGIGITTDELYKEIVKRAKEVDKTFECVITFDNSFV